MGRLLVAVGYILSSLSYFLLDIVTLVIKMAFALSGLTYIFWLPKALPWVGAVSLSGFFDAVKKDKN